MDCRHNFRYTNGQFHCIHCGKVIDKHDNKNKTKSKNSTKRRSLVTLSYMVVFFCVLSVLGTVLIGSDDYLDVKSSMMFYYDAIAYTVYKADIQNAYDTIVNLDAEQLAVYFEERRIQIQEQIQSIRTDTDADRTIKDVAGKQAELTPEQIIQRDYEILIHAYTNAERARYDLEPLSLDEHIGNVARLHSLDMLDNDFFEHENLQGQTPTDRGNALGVSCIKDYGSYYTKGLGENIFYLEGYKTGNILKNSKFIVDGWMDSPGHRENILRENYEQIGIGVQFSNSKIYATQNFC